MFKMFKIFAQDIEGDKDKILMFCLQKRNIINALLDVMNAMRMLIAMNANILMLWTQQIKFVFLAKEFKVVLGVVWTKIIK